MNSDEQFCYSTTQCSPSAPATAYVAVEVTTAHELSPHLWLLLSPLLTCRVTMGHGVSTTVDLSLSESEPVQAKWRSAPLPNVS